jgi:hypothetical protein
VWERPITIQQPGQQLDIKMISPVDSNCQVIPLTPDPINVGTAAIINHPVLTLCDDGQAKLNYQIETHWRTDCVPGDGCHHIDVTLELFRGSTIIQSINMGILISCFTGVSGNSGTFDSYLFNQISGVRVDFSASRGFTC